MESVSPVIVVSTDLISANSIASLIGRTHGGQVEAFVAYGWHPSTGDPNWIDYDVVAARTDLQTFRIFVAGDATELNQRRLACYLDCKRAKMRITNLIGAGSHVASDVRIRENTLIADRVLIDSRADLGANVVIGTGTQVGSDARIGHSAWIGSSCSIGPDTKIGKNCVLGDGVHLSAGVSLEPWSLIAAGTRLEVSPATTIFVDPLFRAPVQLRGVLTPK